MSLDITKDRVWYDKGGKAIPVSMMSEYHVRNALRVLIGYFNDQGIENIHAFLDKNNMH